MKPGGSRKDGDYVNSLEACIGVLSQCARVVSCPVHQLDSADVDARRAAVTLAFDVVLVVNDDLRLVVVVGDVVADP